MQAERGVAELARGRDVFGREHLGSERALVFMPWGEGV